MIFWDWSDHKAVSNEDRSTAMHVWDEKVAPNFKGITIDKMAHTEAEDIFYALFIKTTGRTISRNHFSQMCMNLRKRAHLQGA